MDRRSWPWKKKSSEKGGTTIDSIKTSLSNSAVGQADHSQADQDNNKAVSYVQISAESYAHLTAHLTELEDQVKDLNQKLASVHESLSSAESEITAKDILVKQHAKVAEEAVSGWEKAEGEAMALKQQLEAVTLQRLTAEERACHFDGALKECMKQIRNVKEESEQKLQDVVFAKTQQWEKIKVELEGKIADFEQDLRRASAENAAISRNLQERSHMLMKISEEKSQADAEIEILKNNIQSCEKDINSWKYELHVASKELEIRNEEKNMSMRSAEVANRQRLEDVKKIAKLEAECQRLRGLVRKKLPGPAALAQMKVEVESLGREYGDSRIRRSSPARGSSPRHTSVTDFSFENTQQFQKENEFLTERLFAVEEETKMLKEALSKRNSELQAARNLCAKTANKLHSLEAHILAYNQQKSPLKPNISLHLENGSNPPSLTSMSEDGIDDEGSCSESWATTLIVSELSQFKKDKSVDKDSKADNMEIMDDFLEMERLACLSTEVNENVALPNGMQDKMKTENDDATSSVDIPINKVTTEQQSDLERPTNQASCGENLSTREDVPLVKLQSRIASIFDTKNLDSDVTKILEQIRCILLDTQEQLPQQSVSCIVEETRSGTTSEHNDHFETTRDTTNNVISLEHGSSSCTDTSVPLEVELKDAISQIHDSIVSLGKEAAKIQGLHTDNTSLSKKIEDFSSSVNKVLCNQVGLHDFILGLSQILSESTDLNSVMFRDKPKEGDSNSECIDKVTLLENKIDQHEPRKDRFSSACSSSDLDIEGSIPQDFEVRTTAQKCSLEEFEQLKMEKEEMQMDLSRYTETLEETNLKLFEMDKHLTELKAQLAASEKSNSLAETQLKCMAESYKSLESRTQELELHAQDLEREINLLRTKAETLDSELQEERQSHQIDLAKYDELLDHLERNEKSSMCSFPTDVDLKTNQEKEIAAAAEKLAECQETIFLLGRQLKALGPPDVPNHGHQINDGVGYEPSPSGINFEGTNGTPNSDYVESENTVGSVTPLTTGGESPVHGYNSHTSPSDLETGRHPSSPLNSKRQKHRSTTSGSSSSSAEKQNRGFSRFFSKPKRDDD